MKFKLIIGTTSMIPTTEGTKKNTIVVRKKFDPSFTHFAGITLNCNNKKNNNNPTILPAMGICI